MENHIIFCRLKNKIIHDIYKIKMLFFFHFEFIFAIIIISIFYHDGKFFGFLNTAKQQLLDYTIMNHAVRQFGLHKKSHVVMPRRNAHIL